MPFALFAMLAHPIVEVKLTSSVDASDYAIGALLQQSVNGLWQPFAFFTKSLSAQWRKYWIYNLIRAVC